MKKIIIIILVSVTTGFIIGRVTTNKLSKRQVEITTKKFSTSVQQVSTQREVKKDSTTVKQMSYTEKFFNNKGILIHEIVMGNNTKKSATGGYSLVNEILKKTAAETLNTSTTIETYQSNFIVGIYYPVKDLTNYKVTDLGLNVSYRLFSTFYVSVLSDVKFSNPQIGLQFQF